MAQAHHAYHSAAAEVKHTSLYTSASLTAVDSVPTRVPTVEELKAYALVKHLQTELQAQSTAAGQAVAAAAKSATLLISHNGKVILALEG